MKTTKPNARRLLRNSIDRIIVPELEKRGFKPLRIASKSPPILVFNRLRPDGGFDVIDIMMKSGSQPQFDAQINSIPKAGVCRPWHDDIPAKDAMASDMPERVSIASNTIQNRTFRALARWIGIGWFGFKSSGNADLDEKAADRSCYEFVTALCQADIWWASKQLGPNLVKEVIGVVHK